MESRHRLLSLCFVFDVHQALYLEQSRLKTDSESMDALLVLPCSGAIWSATDISEWHSRRSQCTIQPLRLIQQQLLSSSTCTSAESPFSEFLLICSFAARLPVRKDNVLPEFIPTAIHPAVNDLTRLFPASLAAHIYLALHYTPLRDLLAVAGDTWVFAKKVTPPSAFHAAQSRLKAWSQSLAAARATQYACKVLQARLGDLSVPSECEQRSASQALCISDYWGLYTAALICWAFGQRYQLAFGKSSTMQGASRDSSDPDQDRVKALLYTRSMLELDTSNLLTSKASMRGDTSGLIDAVRALLETVGVGSKCMMLVDAVCVLRRIGEGGKVKWF